MDYTAVHAYLRAKVRSRAKRLDLFERICAAERATLDVWAIQREEDERRSSAATPKK